MVDVILGRDSSANPARGFPSGVPGSYDDQARTQAGNLQ